MLVLQNYSAYPIRCYKSQSVTKMSFFDWKSYKKSCNFWYTLSVNYAKINSYDLLAMELIGGTFMNKASKIKDLPIDQRPYEKCEKYGPSFLADSELLAIIIRTGVKGKKSIELADEIIGENGLIGLCRVSLDELTKTKGVGKVKALQIMCIVELALRISKGNMKEKMIFNTPLTVAEYFMEELRHKNREEFIVLMLTSKSTLIKKLVLSIGTVNKSLASPREIFVEAIRCNAVCIILIHNHPSGDPTPSRADIDVTRRIKEAGELIEIKLIDHIIIGDNKYTSFSECELI